MTLSYNLKHRIASVVRRKLISRPIRDLYPETEENPVVVAGLFSTGSGIGQSARACYRALVQAGIECQALDLSPKFNQVDLISDIPTVDTLPPDRSGTMILHLNGPETEHGLYQAGMRFGRKWRVIGYWAWELLEPPMGWAKATEHLTEIWTPSEFVRSSIAPIVDIPVRVVPHYISVPRAVASTSETRSEDSKGLVFLTMADGFSSFHRKNIFAAIRAYKTAFSDSSGHKLVIKCRNLEKYADIHEALKSEIKDRSDISLMSKTLLENDVWDLIKSSDVVLSLHRAEGFGLHLAEAMALGKVVIATAWSGNLSFMNPNNSILVSSELIPLKDPTGVYQQFEGALWAEANVSDATDKLRKLTECAKYRRRIGDQARRDIELHLSPKRYLDALIATSEVALEDPIPCVAE